LYSLNIETVFGRSLLLAKDMVVLPQLPLPVGSAVWVRRCSFVGVSAWWLMDVEGALLHAAVVDDPSRPGLSLIAAIS